MAILEIGTKIHRFTVLGLSHKDARFRKFYNVQCDCGKTKILNGALIKSGNTRSCGCLSLERKRAQRLPKDKGIINQIVLQAKRHARDRGIEWKIGNEMVGKIIRMPCAYCGDLGGNLKTNKANPSGFRYNGLDRINNNLGYLENNVAPCCRKCNNAKSNMSLREFREWALRLCAMAEQWG